MGRELLDKNGNTIFSCGKMCDFYDPYWRVELRDGDWEDFTRRELSIVVADQLPPPISQET